MTTIIDIISNKDKEYEGDLKGYFKIIMEAPNVLNPYHGIRHMLHVTYMCYEACCEMREVLSGDVRNLLIAALFHDFGHTGKTGNDSEQIILAVQGFEKHCLPEDIPYKDTIIKIIQSTEYPHKNPPQDIIEQIIRDADISQTLSDVWIEHTLYDLSRELGITPRKMLEQQLEFLPSIKFYTTWGKNKFKKKIKKRIKEVKKMLKVWQE